MIVLDANILMEMLEERKSLGNVQAAIAKYTNNTGLFMSTLTVSHLFYLAEKQKISSLRVQAIISTYELLDVTAKDVIWALDHYEQIDFEDALQVAAAIREGCKTFITLDKKLASKYGKHLNIQLIQ